MRAIVLAACVVLVVAVLVAMLFAAMTTPRGCDGVDAETLTPEQAGQLISRGWYGDPEDQREALYPSRCYPGPEGSTRPKQYDGKITPVSGA